MRNVLPLAVLLAGAIALPWAAEALGQPATIGLATRILCLGIAAASLNPPVSRLEFLAVLSENTPEALAGEHPVLSLAIGAPQPDGTLPVHIEGTPEIAFVPAAFLNNLPAE